MKKLFTHKIIFKIKYSYGICFLLLFNNLITGLYSQTCPCFNNPSFEGGTPGTSVVPPQWIQCTTSCDIGPVAAISNKPASNGSYWQGLGGTSSTSERFGQQLCSPLQAGQQYSFNVDIAILDKLGTGGYALNPGSIEIWASPNQCAETQRIFTTPVIQLSDTSWHTYCVQFTANANHNYIVFKLICGPPCNGLAGISYFIVDNIRCSAIQLNVTDDKIICNASGQCATISASASGGSGNYTYTWTPNIGAGPGPHNVCPTVTTKYMVSVSDGVSCGNPSDSVTVTVSCGPTVTATGATVCSGNSGSISATASGGTGPYTYTWSPATGLSSTTGTPVTANPATTTTYTVTVKDNTGATASNTVIVTVNNCNPPPSACICLNNPSFDNGTVGSNSWPAPWNKCGDTPDVYAGGTNGDTYLGIGALGSAYEGVTQQLCSSLQAGTTYSLSIDVKHYGSGPFGSTGTLEIWCGNSSCQEGQLLWSVNVLPSATSWQTFNATLNPTSSCNQFTIRLRSSGGAYLYLDNITATCPPGPSVTATGVTICAGNSGSISATASGGTGPYTYTWSPATGLSSTTGTPVTANPATTTTYTVTVKDNTGATASNTAIVTVNPGPCNPPASGCANLCLTNPSFETGGGVGSGSVPTPYGMCGDTPDTYDNGGSDGSKYVGVGAISGVYEGITQQLCAPLQVGTKYNVSMDIKHMGSFPFNSPGIIEVVCGGANCGSNEILYSTPQIPPTATAWQTINFSFTPTTSCTYITFRCKYISGNGTYIYLDNIVDKNPPCGPSITATGITICSGSNGTLTATGSSGTGPYTYTWSPATGLSNSTGTSVTASPSATTTYTVTVKDNTGATASTTAVVIVNTAPTINITGSTTICAGQSTTLTASGGGTYLWNTGASTTSITANPAATTSYTVTASTNGCTGSKSVVVTVMPLPVPTISGVITICSGQSTTLTATGGGTYSWAPGGQTTAGITISPAGNTTYTVTVTSGGCSGTATAQVTVAAGLSPTITGITNICPGTSTVLTANSGGTYSWNTGATTTAITVSPAGNTSYTVTVTSGTCTGTATVQVSIVNPPTPIITGTVTICNGTSTILTASGGNTYNWNTGATSISITVNPTSNTSYSVTATNASGCTGTATIAVTVNPNPVPTISGITTICTGTSTTLTATGGGTYAWSDGTTNPNITVTPMANTTYSVIVTNAGCTGSAAVTVNVAANLIPIITGNTNICTGTSTTLSTSGGGTYAWNDGTSNSSITVSPTTNTSYSITVTNGSCSGTATVLVTVVNNPTPAITGNTSICPGTSTILTANGGNTYVWNTGETTASITVSPLSQTTYTVTANASGCTGSTTVTVTIIPPPNPTVADQVICIGNSATLTATAGGTYSWNTGETTGTITVTPTITTTYTVIVTTGCSASATAQVAVQPALIPTIAGPLTICKGSSLILSTSGGGTYQWSDGTTNSTITVSPATSTTYSVTVTNGLCSGTAQHPVIVNPNPAPVITGNLVICNGSSTILTADAGGTYSWDQGQTSSSITVSPVNTSTYTVTVTTNGCTGMATAKVTVNPTPAPGISGPTSICSGQSATLTTTGTSGPYLWNTGESTNAITVTPAGTITYSVSVTLNGCTGTAAQVVIVVPQVIAKVTDNSSCAGENVSLSASGGTSYLWNTGVTTNNIIVSPASTTTYTVIVAVGACADTATCIVTVHPLPIATASGDTTINYGSKTQLNASGGGIYHWIPSTGLSCTGCANPIATPTATTQYCVIIKDTAGCIDSACVIVRVDLKCGFEEGDIFVPNGFSPNGDGQNDELHVRGTGIIDMYWAIYDRWGEKVFETTDPKQGWDGTYKGIALDPAVFVYYLKVICITGDEIDQKGNVSIIK